MSSYPGIPPGWIVLDMEAPHPEPLSVLAGDSLQWTRSFDDYPASAGWTLTYVLNNANARFVVAAEDVTVDSDSFSVSIPSSETKTWVPGHYLWLAVIQSADKTQRFTVAAGRVLVRPDILDAQMPIDTREPEEIALDNIRAVLAGRASDGVLEYKINDREIRRYSMDELLRLKSYFAAEVKRIRIRRGETVLTETVAVHMGWGING